MNAYRDYVPIGSGFAVALGLTFYIVANQIGPRIFWSSDLCPDPNVTCGVLPLGPVVAVVIGAVVAVAVAQVLNGGRQ